MEREGFRLVTALDGRAALAAAGIERPGLVTDRMMPGIDRVELCRRLKGETAAVAVSVVMLSAALPPHPEELLKPTPIGRLMKTIHALLEGRRPERPGVHPDSDEPFDIAFP